jgi:hypothetical protein
VLKSKNIFWKAKLKTVIRPVINYGSETWTLTKTDESQIDIWERKVRRIISGLVNDRGIWQIGSNKRLAYL